METEKAKTKRVFKVRTGPALTDVQVVAGKENAENTAVKEATNAPNDSTVIKVNNPIMDDDYEKKQDEKRYNDLKIKVDNCKIICANLQKELNDYEQIREKQKIENITLPTDAKLIDFLLKVILDPSDDWKDKINTLILIPHSLPGNFLRGGDYFEALFQLAIVLGILPAFSGKFIRMYDIKKYKDLKPELNYLHEKSIRNSGANEQGISDITFEVSSSANFDEMKTGYKCGEKPNNTISAIPFYLLV